MTPQFQEALECCRNREFERAIALFSTHLEVHAQHMEAFYNRGLAQLKLGKLQEAEKDFTKALEIEPRNAITLGDRAVVWHHLKEKDKALKDLHLATEIEPENPYRYSSRAFIRAAWGDVEGAIEDYQIALSLDPEDAITLNNLGLAEERLGRMESAKRRFEKADKIAGVDEAREKIYSESDITLTDKPAKGGEDDPENLKKEFNDFIEKHDKQKAEVSERLQQQEQTPSKPTAGAYWGVLKDTLTKRETFNEFLQFWKQKFMKGE